ncbi:MAG: hypothetical protein M3M96_05380, partial [Candidatus Eremiobacteraeota bacterium]|nr:hypothetical protein [Candidatus Eremiobacteraeota bacterium]
MIARGRVLGVGSGTIEISLPAATIGDGVRIERTGGSDTFGVITGLSGARADVTPMGRLGGVHVGGRACVNSAALFVPLGLRLLGRAIDACGEPLDGEPNAGGLLQRCDAAMEMKERRAICEPFWTGVRVLDALLVSGRGARMGIFGAPGCGKSSLLQSIATNSGADVVVVGLVGERGREAEAWIQALTARTTVVCATSDRAPLERIRAAKVAMAQAVALRDRGLHVLLVLDSLARFGAALREVSAAAGETVGRGGYSPSVFAELAKYVEVAGNARVGSITMFASVLSDGDERDPLSDAARSLLDGHIELSATMARAGKFPAIDILASSSRTMNDVVNERHASHANFIRSTLDSLAKTEDARSLGMGTADGLDRQNAAEAALEEFLRGPVSDARPALLAEGLASLAERLS